MTVRLVTPWMEWKRGRPKANYGRYYIDEYHRQNVEGAYCSIVMVERIDHHIQKGYQGPYFSWRVYDDVLKEAFYASRQRDLYEPYETAEAAMKAADEFLHPFNLKFISQSAFNLLRQR